MTDKLPRYWVSYTAALADSSPQPLPGDEVVKAFSKRVVAALNDSFPGSTPALLFHGQTRSVVMSAVFHASSASEALSKARVAFQDAIDRAGAVGDIPDGADSGWRAHVLDRAVSKIVPLAA